MTVRFHEPPLDSTVELLSLVLPILLNGERVLFLAPPGQGAAVIQRLRVMISRQRKDLLSRGKRYKRFCLKSSIHSETHHRVRYDACVLYIKTSQSSKMLEEVERLMSNG